MPLTIATEILPSFKSASLPPSWGVPKKPSPKLFHISTRPHANDEETYVDSLTAV